MDSVKSINGYGKVDEEAQDLGLKSKREELLISIGISVFFFVFMVIGTLGAVAPFYSWINYPTELTPAESLRIVCSKTRYPASCISSISKKLLPSSNTTTNVTDAEIIFRLSLKVVLDELNSISHQLAETTTDDERIKSALGVCGDLFDEAVNETISAMDDVGDGKNIILNSTKIDHLQTWLSAAVTDQDMCLHTLDQLSTNNSSVYANSTILQTLKSAMVNSTEFTSNSLAIAVKVIKRLSDIVHDLKK